MPDKDALLGLQKLAANASNTATKHILMSLLKVSLRVCENISLKAADALRNPLLRNSLANSISTFNTNTLEELISLQLHDFGISLKMEPEEEDIAKLEANVQVALQSGAISLSDAIDVREISNMKLANKSLCLRQQQKIARDQELSERNIQAQAQANAQAQEAAAMAEVQKQQAITAEKVSIEQAKVQFEIQKMQTEAQIKRELMAEEFGYKIKLEEAKIRAEKSKGTQAEDRKDERTRIQATQQSELIAQRKNDETPKNFETNQEVAQFGTQNVDLNSL